MRTCSIIIPTLGRSESLRECLESLWKQTYQDFEIIKVTDEGELAALRNQGARRAVGEYLIFIDDDVVCHERWLESILTCFRERTSVAGVSGPAIITKRYRRNRDIFRYRRFKFLYDLFLCEGKQHLPGYITKSGAWTTGASLEKCNYEGEVHFLEACNMAYRSDIFNQLGGFDTAYKGVGDWSEPDLSFRVRRAGYSLWFSRNAKLEHRPSCSGAFKKRSFDAFNRIQNYELFSKRWVAPCWQHSFYKWFMKIYYEFTAIK